jgi:hypothetical protein
LTDLNVLLGQSATLSITCDAFPAPKVTWYEFHLYSLCVYLPLLTFIT